MVNDNQSSSSQISKSINNNNNSAISVAISGELQSSCNKPLPLETNQLWTSFEVVNSCSNQQPPAWLQLRYPELLSIESIQMEFELYFLFTIVYIIDVK